MKKVAITALLTGVIQITNAQTNSFPTTGNVGIGTLSPLAKLEIFNGFPLVKNFDNLPGNSAIMIAHTITDAGYATFGTSIGTFVESSANNTYGMRFFTMESYETNQTEKMRIQGNGNVGIGTTTPNEKLTVNGKIRTREVKVESANWPDYVFANDYQKMPLPQLEQFIEKNKHLPEMPSAQQVAKEGIALGANQAALLKKIEELTLYIIDQNKEIKKQNEKIAALEAILMSNKR